jgi:hypothetical protein
MGTTLPASLSSGPAGREVQMQVKYYLPRAALYVNQQFVPGAIDRHLFCDVPRLHKHMGDNRKILFGQVVDTPYVFEGYNKQMDRCVGVNIIENDYQFVPVNDVGIPTPGNNLAKNAVSIHRLYPPGNALKALPLLF